MLLLSKNENEENALHLASKSLNGDSECLEYLLETPLKKCINDVDKFGFTALHLAAKLGQEDRVKILLEKGANIELKDHKGNTALHLASSKGHLEVMQVLLDQNKGLNRMKNDKGRSPLHCAALFGQIDGVRMLLEEKLVNQPDKCGMTPLHLAAYDG